MMAPDVSELTPTPTQRTHGISARNGGGPATHPPPRTGIHFELDLRPSIQHIEAVPLEIEVAGHLRFQAIETGIKRPQLSESECSAGVDEAVEKPYGICRRPRPKPLVGRVFKSGTLTEHPRLHRHHAALTTVLASR
jgi:hypothetical protein